MCIAKGGRLKVGRREAIKDMKVYTRTGNKKSTGSRLIGYEGQIRREQQ